MNTTLPGLIVYPLAPLRPCFSGSRQSQSVLREYSQGSGLKGPLLISVKIGAGVILSSGVCYKVHVRALGLILFFVFILSYTHPVVLM